MKFQPVQGVLETVIANALICLMVSVFYDWQAQVALFICISLPIVWPKLVKACVLFFNYYVLVFPTGIYKTVGYGGPGNLFFAFAGLVIFLSLSGIFIFWIKRFHLTILMLVGAISYFALEKTNSGAMHQILQSLTLMWAYNFIILLKEADGKDKSKTPADILFTLNAFWNMPYFINLSSRSLESYRCQTQLEASKSRRAGVFLLAKASTVCLTINYLIHLAKYKRFEVIDIYSELLRINFTSLSFDEFSSYNIFNNIGLESLFAILAGGTITLGALLYMNAAAVGILCAFGYRVPYPELNMRNLKMFSGFVQQLYYFYNKTMLETFYPRILSFFTKIGLPRPFFHRSFIVFSMILYGGSILNFVTDAVMYAAVFDIEKIFKMTILSFPYFVLLSVAIIAAYSTRSAQLRARFSAPARIAFYSLVMSMLFSLHRPFFIGKSVEEILEIFRNILLKSI